MTSTNISVGIASEKLTSRVLKPPGGGHTNIFGPVEPEAPKRNRRGESSIVLGGDTSSPRKATIIEPSKAENGNEEQKEEIVTTTGENGSEVDAHFVRDEPQNPDPVSVKTAVQEPPKRVRVPPGGFSSGLW